MPPTRRTPPSVMPSVAILGAGPGGLVAARHLQAAGYRPTLFEQADGVGGQWRLGAPASRVWPGMRTNSSRVLTAFGDLAHPEGTPVYPSAEAVGAYLERYAERFGLVERTRTGTRVEHLERDERTGRWQLRSRGSDGVARTESFGRVVVATGWCGRPTTPHVEGLGTFVGRGGVTHAADYRGAEPFRGLRVLVAGGGISALEVASELALHGAAEVVVASRRQRYVLQKLLAGVPADHVAFTRFAALAAESLPPAEVDAGLRALVVGTSGSPEQYGAPRTAESVFAAGLTLSQTFLPLVADGRIAVRPWLARVDGREVRFADGSAATFDAIVFGTGYEPELPFLGARVRAAVGLAPSPGEGGAFPGLGLYKHTFHPDLPGIAFLGLFEQIGPHLPTLELQARWIAYAWSGRIAAPRRETMAAALAAAAAVGAAGGAAGGRQAVPMHAAARLFATAAGVEPDPHAWPALARALFFGPLSPASFRLSGPDALSDAPARVALDAAAFGAGGDRGLTPDQAEQLRSLADARGDARLAALVDRIGGTTFRAPGPTLARGAA